MDHGDYQKRSAQKQPKQPWSRDNDLNGIDANSKSLHANHEERTDETTSWIDGKTSNS